MYFFCDMHQAQKQIKDIDLFFDTAQKKREIPLTWCLKVIMVILVKFNHLQGGLDTNKLTLKNKKKI